MLSPAAGSAIERLRAVGRSNILAAFERNHRNAGQPLKIEANLGVGLHRSARCNGNRHIDPPRTIGSETQIGDLADLYAVEQHRRANQ